MQPCSKLRNSRDRAAWAFALIAIIAGPCCGAEPLNLDTTVDPAPQQPLTLGTAEQYLSNSSFYGQVWDPALMSLATGSDDPEYHNQVDPRRFEPETDGQLQAEEGAANAAVALDEGPTPCPGGFSIRTVDGFGAVRTIRVTESAQASSTGGGQSSGPRFLAINSQDDEWAREIIHFGREVGRKHEIDVPIGAGKLELAAQLNSGRQAVIGQEPPLAGTISYARAGGLSIVANPTPLFDNQVVDRLDMTWAKPGSSTQFNVRNISWRRSASFDDCSQVDGGAWVAGVSEKLNARSSISAACSRWSDDGQWGSDAIVTGEYRPAVDHVYGLGLMDATGSVSPFASYAHTLRGGGSLYLSMGAPLDDRTRVPFACRLSMPL